MRASLRLGAICLVCACCHGSAGRAAVVAVPGATFETDGNAAASDSLGGGNNQRYQSFAPVGGRALSAASDGSTTTVALANTGFLSPAMAIEAQSVVGLPAAYSSDFSTGAGSEGNANLQYFFEILGPTPTVPVLVQASGDLVTSAVGPGIVALLNLGIGGPGVTIFDETWTNGGAQGNATLLCGSAGCGGHIREHSVYTFETDQIYDVAITASVTVGGSISVPAYGTITSINAGLQGAAVGMDPYFSVAPGTPDAGAYSFVFSDGIGNAPIASIPEPPVWALLGVGFMIMGGACGLRGKSART